MQEEPASSEHPSGSEDGLGRARPSQPASPRAWALQEEATVSEHRNGSKDGSGIADGGEDTFPWHWFFDDSDKDEELEAEAEEGLCADGAASADGGAPLAALLDGEEEEEEEDEEESGSGPVWRHGSPPGSAASRGAGAARDDLEDSVGLTPEAAWHSGEEPGQDDAAWGDGADGRRSSPRRSQQPAA